MGTIAFLSLSGGYGMLKGMAGMAAMLGQLKKWAVCLGDSRRVLDRGRNGRTAAVARSHIA